MAFDIFLFKLINGLAGKWWLLNWLGIFFASYLAYLLVIIAIFLLIKEKDWRQRIYFFSLTVLSVILARGIITEIIRFFYYRPRPFLALKIQPLINPDLSGSFPSGHATAFFALALAVFYFLYQTRHEPNEKNQKLGWWFLGATFLMGLARIFVGVHWPLDIIAGALIGLGSAFLIKKILPIPKSKIENAPVD